MMNTNNNNAQTNESILWIRFFGPNLETKSIPIFELGQTLTAFQTILHKAYLFKEGCLTKGAVVTKDERSKLALRIVKRHSGSDEYGLIPFLTDPVIVDHIKVLLVDALIALGAYTLGRVTRKRKKGEDSENQPFVGSIYNQVNIIVDRINNIGGIESIEISTQDELNAPSIIIDKSTQEYVRELEFEPVYGEVEQIEGTVVRLHTRRFIAVIQRKPGDYLRVWLNPEDFEVVRYQTDNSTLIRFEGRPMYFLGRETSKFEDFEADRIVSMKKLEE